MRLLGARTVDELGPQHVCDFSSSQTLHAGAYTKLTLVPGQYAYCRAADLRWTVDL